MNHNTTTDTTTDYKTEMLTFRGTPTLKELLDRVSRRENQSRSDYIRETLERALPVQR
jgi:predicted DNA-binding protein